MNDDEVRALVRQAINRHATSAPLVPQTKILVDDLRQHSSQALFPGPGGDAQGMCVIEPCVPCVHCGYCRALGH